MNIKRERVMEKQKNTKLAVGQKDVKVEGQVYLEPIYLEAGFLNKIGIAQVLYRYDLFGNRHYWNESAGLVKSLTTLISAVSFPAEKKSLDNWRTKMLLDLGSEEKVDTFVESTATYGTLLHEAVAEFARSGSVKWSEFKVWTMQRLEDEGFTYSTAKVTCESLTRDFMAVIQFFADYRVKVLAVELPVYIPGIVGTLLDLVVEMDEKHYVKTPEDKRKRVVANINLKSGKGPTFTGHLLQLVGERMCFNHIYGRSYGMLDKVFNLCPKDWYGDTPTYDLRDQTDKIAEKKLVERFNARLTVAKLEGLLDITNMKVMETRGETKYGQSPVPSIHFVPYLEHLKSLREQLRNNEEMV